ncbi:TGS-like protein [Pseudocohnilembus persalinus]|uniref:TGS-like protein n=1 Tax=Pseudocohnilembus persalinus TaxID=266149 RepID=A0A0V0QYS2_PSEPJ|nr:TGS-like protein [Pseudocohnilembus persalinus]|eukprot:KRX07410.1 TGS-like protein [Pseudocohnilembus persalinus]
MGIQEKIKEIEAEYAKTQKNKATEGHLGLLKAKLAKLRTQLLEPSGGGGKGEGFDVQKNGNARICMIGFPSVGKSTLLSTLTDTKSLAAGYEFTTLTCIPGNLYYNNAKIQLLDLPGIIEGAADGRGRGRQVIAVGKASDMIWMVLDAGKAEAQKEKLTAELEKCGIRLNKKRPNITITINKIGGLKILSMKKLKYVKDEQIKSIFSLYKIHNAQISIRDDDVTIDDIIDTIEGNRKYVPCIYIYNKIDVLSIEEVDEIAREPRTVVISCNLKLNFDTLLARSWEELGLVRVFTKRKGHFPDLTDPLILSEDRGGCTVRQAIEQIHRNLLLEFSHAQVWGRSVKFNPQSVGLSHPLSDLDVIQIYKKTGSKSKESKTQQAAKKVDVKATAKNAFGKKKEKK